jgi:hypothetical protein
MELASKIRWIVVIAATSIALLLVVWGLFSIASNIFRGDGRTSLVTELNGFDIEEVEAATFRVDGPIVARENHRSYTITVSSNVVSMRVYAGYGETLLAEQSYRNTPESYRKFLSALANANIVELRRGVSTDLSFEDVGVCARGRRYYVNLDTDIFRWSTSCSDREGNANFSMSPVASLFEAQIPDYAELTRNAQF